VLFDLTDLLHHYLRNKAPTGIQRVQAEVAMRLLETPRTKLAVRLVCYVPNAAAWVAIPRGLFAALTAAASSGSGQNTSWQPVGTAIHALLAACTARTPIPNGAVLLNLGSSWWSPNYLMNVRQAQAKWGLRYLPFVHDCIPVLRPDLCVTGLPAQFLSWLAGAGLAADGIITSTHATAGQVRSVLTEIGIESSPISVVPLDACPLRAETGISRNCRVVPKRPYVLFVSTLERRKDHALAFRAWLDLAERHPPALIPQLVCVGNPGWRNEAAYGLYAGHSYLRSFVTILSDLDDADLAALYAHCICTLYPSRLEGWGLPVTEALSYGKVPIVARTHGVTEAAGALGEYFSPGSLVDLVAAIERVCFNTLYRTAAEARIATRFQPRTWEAVADAFVDEITAVAARSHLPVAHRISILDRYFAFGHDSLLRSGLGLPIGEHLRRGCGWLAPEPLGCPTRLGVAEFVLPVLMDARSASLAVCLHNGGNEPLAVVVSVAGASASHLLPARQTQWATLVLDIGSKPAMEIRVRLHSANARAQGGAGRGVTLVGAMLRAGPNGADCLRRAAAQRNRLA
jgi:glycosyltransferase involved in cell wall biosynthesis